MPGSSGGEPAPGDSLKEGQAEIEQERKELQQEARQNIFEAEGESQEKELDHNEEWLERIEDIIDGEWEQENLRRRIERDFGKGFLGRAKAWMSGVITWKGVWNTEELEIEKDLNFKKDLGRKMAKVGLKTVQFGAYGVAGAGAMAILFGTGFTALPLLGGIGGALAARGLFETGRSLWSGERRAREEINAGYLAVYGKVKELANEVLARNLEEEGYLETCEKLIDYMHNESKHLVRFERDEDGKLVGAKAVLEAEEGALKLSDLEKKARARERKLEKISDVVAVAGGIGGSLAGSLLQAKMARDALESGGKVLLDLDGDKNYHWVMKSNELTKAVGDEYVFAYNATDIIRPGETAAQFVQNLGPEAGQPAQYVVGSDLNVFDILRGGNRHLVHALGESVARVNAAIKAEAFRAVPGFAAGLTAGFLGGLGYEGTIGRLVSNKRYEEYQKSQERAVKYWQRRAEKMAKYYDGRYKKRIEELCKFYDLSLPEVDEIWHLPSGGFKSKIDNQEVKTPGQPREAWLPYKVTEIRKGYVALQRYNRETRKVYAKEEPLKVRIEDLLFFNRQDQKVEEGQSSPEPKPSGEDKKDKKSES